MPLQYYDLKIHMNIVHGDAYVPTEDEGETEDEDDEDEFNSGGDESEVENSGGSRKRKRVNSCPYCHQGGDSIMKFTARKSPHGCDSPSELIASPHFVNCCEKPKLTERFWLIYHNN